jgi:hypothetical protein
MPIIKTRYACPTCHSQINAENHILVCSKNRTHTWNDLAEFMSLRPKKWYEEAKPTIMVQPNWVKVEVSVPPRIKTALEDKYGNTANATIAGVLGMLAEGEILIVPETDLNRIKEKFGKKPESSGELFGMIYNLTMELDTAKMISDEAKKNVDIYEGKNPSGVLVNMGQLYGQIVEKAKDQGETVKMWLERNLKNAIENNWF